jgi:serine/threonine protein kinase
MVKRVGPYELRSILGKGTFGTVYLGKHLTTNAKIAVKVINKETLKPELLSRLEQEILCQKSVDSVHIVKLLDVQKTENNFYLILEYCEGGDLGSFIKKHGPVSESVAQRWTQQIVEGFKALHRKNIIHRDLKLQNILMTEASTQAGLKLADFGLSRFLEDDLAKTWVGTPLYMAPEIINLQEYDGKADIWSLGLVLYELLTGELPIKVHKREQIPAAQKNIRHFPESLSEECRALLGRLLEYDHSARISFEELFMHPFILGMRLRDVEVIEEQESDNDDFVLLDESTHESATFPLETNSSINVEAIEHRVESGLVHFKVFWKVAEQLVHKGDLANALGIFVLAGEGAKSAVEAVRSSMKQHEASVINFPILCEKYEEARQALCQVFAKAESVDKELKTAKKEGKVHREKVLMDYVLRVCRRCADSEYLLRATANKEGFKEALVILEYLNSQSACEVEAKKTLAKFIAETYKIYNSSRG